MTIAERRDMLNDMVEQERRVRAERLANQCEAMRANWEVALRSLASVLRAVNELNGFDISHPDDWLDEGGPNHESVDKLMRILMLVVTEVSEASDEVRKGTRQAFLEEMADTIIRALDLAGGIDNGLGPDFARILVDKIITNAGRGFKHGGKRC